MLGRTRKRSCTAKKADGSPCRAHPRRDEQFCYFHHPDSKTEATEARRLGGIRHRREKTIEGAYDLPDGLRSAEGISRLVEIVTVDLLAMDPSIARANAILRAAGVAARLLETGDLERRIADLEAALAARQPDASSPFDVDLPEIRPPSEPSLN